MIVTLEVVYDHVGKCRKLALCYFIQTNLILFCLTTIWKSEMKQNVTWLKPKNTSTNYPGSSLAEHLCSLYQGTTPLAGSGDNGTRLSLRPWKLENRHAVNRSNYQNWVHCLYRGGFSVSQISHTTDVKNHHKHCAIS